MVVFTGDLLEAISIKGTRRVAALFVVGTGDYSHLEPSFQLEQPRVSGQQIVRTY